MYVDQVNVLRPRRRTRHECFVAVVSPIIIEARGGQVNWVLCPWVRFVL